jgi:hypothetical protein
MKRHAVPLLLSLIVVVPLGARADDAEQMPFEKADKWGFKDATGKIVIGPKYDEVGKFSSGLAPVNLGAKMDHVINFSTKTGGKWGYVDVRGKLVVPITLDYAHEFSDGLAQVSDSQGIRYLDPSGKVAINLGHVSQAGDFHEGLAPVYEDRSLAGKDWRTKFIDKRGLTVFVVDGYVEEFNDGMAALVVKDDEVGPKVSDEGQLYGYIERSGKVAIPPRFGEALAFNEGLAAVRPKKTTVYGMGDTWGYIDKSGKYAIEPQFNEANSFQKGVARVHVGGTLQTPCDVVPYWEGGEWRLIDRTGKVLKQSKTCLEYRDAPANTGHRNCGALGGEPPAKVPQTRRSVDSTTDSRGWELAGLRTRLVPLAKQFTLGQPMKFRLELKNFGPTAVHYDSQAVAGNSSLVVRDPQGQLVPYIGGSFQTGNFIPLPSLAPGKTVVLFDGLDLASQYLLVRPGKYTVQFRGISDEAEAKAEEQSRRRRSEVGAKFFGEKMDWREWDGALIPTSNSAGIDVQPGAVPPVKRIAARLLDVLPKEWMMSVHGYVGETNCSPAWETTPPGWQAGRPMSSVTLACSVTGYIDDTVQAGLWIADGKLLWTGKVDEPGQRAAVYLGKCPEGHIYADLPSHPEAKAAKWPSLEKDLQRALQTVSEKVFFPADGVKDDGDLEIKELRQRDKLYFANSKITDVGLKRLEELGQLKELYLSGTQVTDTGLQHLKGLTGLQVLALNDTNITDVGLEHLRGLAQLRHLDLTGTQVTDAGLVHVKGLTGLQWLYLGKTKVTDAGLVYVKGLTKLQALAMDGTKVTDTGLEHLEGLAQLTWLDLRGTRVTDAGLEHLRRLTQLEGLSLTNTKITDTGLEHLRGLSHLKQLLLDETHVTDAGVKRLRQALPNCEIQWFPPTPPAR